MITRRRSSLADHTPAASEGRWQIEGCCDSYRVPRWHCGRNDRHWDLELLAMLNEMKPRIPDLDTGHFTKVLQSSLEWIPQLDRILADEPGRLEQSRYASLHSQYLAKAEYQYALGYCLSDVSDSVRKALETWDEILKRRGSDDPFVLKVQHNPGAPRQAMEKSPLHPLTQRDYSIGNSADNYTMICLAMAIGDHGTASRLAPQTWDPNEADYVGRDAEYTSIAHQAIAYSLRDLYENRPEQALERLHATDPSSGWAQKNLLAQAQMLHAVACRDAPSFLRALNMQLDWQGRFALDVKKHFKRWSFLSIHSLGLAAFAVKRDVVEWAALPQDNPFLPIDLPRGQ